MKIGRNKPVNLSAAIPKDQTPVLILAAKELADGKTLFTLHAMGYEQEWQTDAVLLQAIQLINTRQQEIMQTRIPKPEAGPEK